MSFCRSNLYTDFSIIFFFQFNIPHYQLNPKTILGGNWGNLAKLVQKSSKVDFPAQFFSWCERHGWKGVASVEIQTPPPPKWETLTVDRLKSFLNGKLVLPMAKEKTQIKGNIKNHLSCSTLDFFFQIILYSKQPLGCYNRHLVAKKSKSCYKFFGN